MAFDLNFVRGCRESRHVVCLRRAGRRKSDRSRLGFLTASDLRSKDLEKAGEGAGWGHSECHAPKYNDTTLRDALSLERRDLLLAV